MRLSTIVFSVILAAPQSLHAGPISADSVFYFRSISGPNSAGLPETDFVALGVSGVEPAGDGGTTAIAEGNGQTIDLPFSPLTGQPNRFATGYEFSEDSIGPWTITLSNEGEQLVIQTPAIGASSRADPIVGVKVIGGTATAPVIQFESPETADNVFLAIIDLNDIPSGGSADSLGTFFVGTDTDTFAVPDGFMEEGGLYSLRLISAQNYDPSEIADFVTPINPTKSTFDTFYDYVATDALVPESYFLPNVSMDGGNPIFAFNNAVIEGELEFYDPIVSIGYDFEIGEDNPNFASVFLPAVGDSLFDVLLPDGDSFEFLATIAAGEEFFFGDEGVGAFRILGIEPSASLDPNDPTAFVTGLSFFADGRFTGTMTPITFDTDSVAVVPLPAGVVLLLTGIFGLGLAGRKMNA